MLVNGGAVGGVSLARPAAYPYHVLDRDFSGDCSARTRTITFELVGSMGRASAPAGLRRHFSAGITALEYA